MNPHPIRRLLPGAAALTLIASCASTPAAPPPLATSLLGLPLEAPAMPEGRARWVQLELDAAMAAWEYQPSELHAIWVGRRLAYAGEYAQAIAWFNAALGTYPDSYRLRRHMGHRFLTLRQIDAAVTILTAAKEIAEDFPNRLEPDGAPGPSGEPRSSTHGNIDYHLALAHYLRGEFDRAAELWLGCAQNWAKNDDSRVAAVHWAFVSLLRADRAAEAYAALDLVAKEPEVIENFAYADLVQVYRGKLPLQEALARRDTSAAFEYGLARFVLASGGKEQGETMLRELAARPGWASFGVLAAEADVAALGDPAARPRRFEPSR